MPLNFPKVIRPLALADYDPQYEGLQLQVWVNPPRGKRERFWSLTLEVGELMERIRDRSKDTVSTETDELVERANRTGQEMLEWLSEILSQGDEESHCTHETLADLADQSPGLYQWILRKSYQTINDYRAGKKKG